MNVNHHTTTAGWQPETFASVLGLRRRIFPLPNKQISAVGWCCDSISPGTPNKLAFTARASVSRACARDCVHYYYKSSVQWCSCVFTHVVACAPVGRRLLKDKRFPRAFSILITQVQMPLACEVGYGFLSHPWRFTDKTKQLIRSHRSTSQEGDSSLSFLISQTVRKSNSFLFFFYI